MTLRERLVALADGINPPASTKSRNLAERQLALAAARMALEELEASNKHLEEQPHTFASENSDRYRGFRDGAIRCQNTARALRVGLV